MSNLVLEGSSKLYGWGETEDGKGLVVWKGDWFQIYDRGTTVTFDDGKLTIAGNGNISFNSGNTGGGTGGGSTNTTTLSGNSDDYGWDHTEDGQGLVVWKGDWFQIYDRGTTVAFDDGKLTISASGEISFGSGNTGGGSTSYTDTLSGSSADYGWDHTEDGQGLVVWKGDWFEIYDAGSKIKFDDGVLTISDNKDISFNGTGGGNTAPTAVDDTNTTEKGEKVSGNVVSNDTDPDGDALTVKVHEQPKNGTVQLNEDGTYTYTPNAGFVGTDTFTYCVYDGKGGEDEATVTITVKEPTDPNTASIGDKVWFDENENGIQDAGEKGLAGVTVQLKDENGNVIATQKSDADGNYSFTNLAAGNYAIGVVDPTGFAVTKTDRGSDDTLDNDISQDTNMSGTIALAAGEHNSSVDIGFCEKPVPKSTIGDRVWLDANSNGIQDDGEKGVAGVTVQLKDKDGNVIKSQQTDANGNYLFNDLDAGQYSVGIVKPDDYNFTTKDVNNNGSDDDDSDIDVATGMSDTIYLGANDHNRSIDAGLVDKPDPKDAALGDRVWFDTNGNGLQDAGEAGAAGVTVQLKDANGNVISTQATDANGNYLFQNLAAGTYAVGVVAPDDYTFTTSDVAGNGADGVDSDIDPTTGMSANVTLAESEQNLTVDAGLVDKPDPQDASLGDRVWFDANGNGLQDDGEAGAAGVTVQLKDANGNVISTQTTDANGNYLFQNLSAGTYSVGVVAPDTYTFTTADVAGNGADGVDSDIDPITGMSANVTLAESEQNLTVDAGLIQPATSSLGDRVWFDKNRNGIQDDNEEGVEGITVQLKDANGAVLDTTTTDATGNYLFDNLTAGDYSVGFANVPEHFEFTAKDALGNGADVADSDVNAATGMTDVINLGIGEQNLTLDAGLMLHCDVNIDALETGFGDTYNRVAYHGMGGANTPFPRVSFWTRIDLPLIDQIDENDTIISADVTYLRERIAEVFGVEPMNIPGQDLTARIFKHSAKGYMLDVKQVFELTGVLKGQFGTEAEIRAMLDEISSEPLHVNVVVEHPDGSRETLHICVDNISAPYIPTTPIVFDLNGDGEIGVTGETTSIDKEGVELGDTVEFDFDGDGTAETIEWVNGSGDGILVDMSKINADGSIDGTALFGDDFGKYVNGYDKLAEHDANNDGQISGDELNNMGLWIDDGDAVLEDGELVSALEAGIASISTELKVVTDGSGRELMQSSATTTDGQTILTEDVWFLDESSSSQSTAAQIDTTPETCCTTEWDTMM